MFPASFRASSPIWAGKASRAGTGERVARGGGKKTSLQALLSLPSLPLSCLLSCASASVLFMDSLLVGYFLSAITTDGKDGRSLFHRFSSGKDT